MSTPSDSFSSEEQQDDIDQLEENDISSPETIQAPVAAETSETTSPDLESPPATVTATTTDNGLPPEAQGEANGGPLGCCLGIMVGLVLSLSVAIFSRFYADPLASLLHSNLSTIVRVVMVIVAIIAVIVCGYFGWKIGRVLYREYDDPRLKKKRRKRKHSIPTV